MEKTENTPYYKECEGIIISAVVSSDALHSALNYQHRAGDLFIVTYPKCGTTWMQHIVMLILRKGKPLSDLMDIFLKSPSLEICGAEAVYNITGTGAIKTHLPFHKMKLCPEAKYIYVARNPKDCLVSFYHHTRNIPTFKFEDGTFDCFFELFMKGKVEHGDYFEHLLSAYERRNDSNIHFTTFESLKQNTRDEIVKIAKFIDEKYEKIFKEEPSILDDIMHYSSFDYMKKEINQNFGLFIKQISDKCKGGEELSSGLKEFIKNVHEMNISSKSKGEFFRKGNVGDWKNYLNKEQEKRLEERIKMKTANSDVMSLWEGI